MKTVLLNWHPWRDNPLDHLGDTLRTPDNKVVTLTKPTTHFVVTVDGKEICRTNDNSVCCGYLWNYQVYQVQP